MLKIRFLAVLLLMTTAPLLSAQSWRQGSRAHHRRGADGRFELTPFGGYTWGGTIFSDSNSVFNQDVEAAGSADYGLNFGIPIGSSSMKLELMVSRQDTHLTTGGGLFEPNHRIADFQVTYYHAGLMIPFSESRNLTPYALVSAGLASLDPDVQGAAAANRFSASAGAGVKVPISPSLALRLEGRGFFTSLGSDDRFDSCRRCGDGGHDFYQGQVNAGLVISF